VAETIDAFSTELRGAANDLYRMMNESLSEHLASLDDPRRQYGLAG
jgi:hypothetical protein